MQEFSKTANQTSYPFILPDLPYGQNALEPILTSQTLEYHHQKHHMTYVTNLNNLIKDYSDTDLKSKTLEQIIHYAEQMNLTAIFNNAAQVWNHTFYWHCLKNAGGGEPAGQLYEQICKDFGDFATFVAEFKQASMTQFGSGWSWLVKNDQQGGRLSVVKTSNAQTPITQGLKPILTCDVWEHAYYIDYRNKRADYIDVFLNQLVNWQFAQDNFTDL